MTARKTLRRPDLYDAVHRVVGLSHTESKALVEQVIKEITDCLERGETVKLTSFGSFVVRKKNQRWAVIRRTVRKCRSHPAAL